MSVFGIAVVAFLSGVLTHTVLWVLSPESTSARNSQIALHYMNMAAICVALIVALALGYAQ